MAQVKITFLLRGIDAKELIKQYKEGNLQNITIPTKKVEIGESKKLTSRLYSQDFNHYSFCRKDKTGNTIVYETTGCNISSTCFWCRSTLDKKNFIGLPIAMIDDKSFYSDGYFCSYSCAYAFYNTHHKDPLYKNTELLIKIAYKLEKGEDKLVAAPDWRLHERNGGSMSDKEYQENAIFARSCNFIPVRIEYMKNYK
jgi:hypothetical protein